MAAVVEVKNFIQCPEAIPPIAEMLFNQWFASRPGKTLEGLIAQMRQGRDDAIPVGLIGFVDGEPAGTVSLLEKDLEECGDLRPWLAGLLVSPEHREKGVADALVNASLVQGNTCSHPFISTTSPNDKEKRART